MQHYEWLVNDMQLFLSSQSYSNRIVYNQIDKQDKYIFHQWYDDRSHKFVYLNLIVHDPLMHIQNAFFKKRNILKFSKKNLTAVRVGNTQSNISQPRAEQTTRSMAKLFIWNKKILVSSKDKRQTQHPLNILVYLSVDILLKE